jgi:hypothetical protein
MIIENAMEARHKTSIHAIITSGALAALLQATTVYAAEVYRWVDENGEVHYSETLPPDFQDKSHDVLNREGLVIDEDQTLTPPPPVEVPKEEERQELPRDASGMPRPKALYSEAEMQQRMDNFLMLRYESEQEILDAMDVEIKQLNYDRRLLEGSQASTSSAYRGQVRVAADKQRAGLPVDPATAREIKNLRGALASNNRSLEGLQQREEAIRDQFDEQLKRFRYLMENWSEESPEG